MRLPRSLPDGRRVEPYSRADAPYFRSPGFYVRIGGLAVLVGVVICVLVLRAWSIQILHGPSYKTLATHQAFRTVDMIGPRGAIVDDKGRLLANTTGHVVVVADASSLGAFDTHGWHASKEGLAEPAEGVRARARPREDDARPHPAAPSSARRSLRRSSSRTRATACSSTSTSARRRIPAST